MVQSYAQNTSNAPATPFSGNVPDRDDFLGSTDETDDLPF
jgi:hypothetical protein